MKPDISHLVTVVVVSGVVVVSVTVVVVSGVVVVSVTVVVVS